jgi:hypothetical protein
MMRIVGFITLFSRVDNCETIQQLMRIRFGKAEITVVVVVVALLLYAMIDIGLFYGPWPWQSPREQDRVVHPSGFSIIKPRGWKERIGVRHDPVLPYDYISLYPDSKARITPFYSVQRLVTAPDAERMKKDGAYALVKFQGIDALGREAVSGKYWRVERIFEQNGNWYAISLMLPAGEGDEIKVHQSWWEYLESFKSSK